MGDEAQLKGVGFELPELPEVPKPVAEYVRAKRVQGLLHVSGQAADRLVVCECGRSCRCAVVEGWTRPRTRSVNVGPWRGIGCGMRRGQYLNLRLFAVCR